MGRGEHGNRKKATSAKKTKKKLLYSSGGRDLRLQYVGEDDGNSLERFDMIMKEKESDLIEAVQNSVTTSTTMGQDPLLLFRWNDDGLAARIPIAAQAGLLTPQNQVVATVDDMKAAIFGFLCSAPDSGTDLGGHHDLIQFLPSHYRDSKMEALMTQHSYLKRHGGPWVALPANANQWPDIVHYVQVITITRANAAVGPVDVPNYFNL
jgi:hypothetical protein